MRADAARNREAVLRAAGQLFDAAQDPDRVSMDDITAAAGVGKGTLFRHFGDRAGLIQELYEERTQQLHAAVEGDRDRTAAENIARLMRALLRFKVENRTLTRALENMGGASPYTNPSYGRLHARLEELISEARGPEAAGFLAHALLAAVRSDLVEHLGDWPEERLEQGLAALVRSAVGPGPC
ncbi:TetR/AcrR family transcriptional regulator [Nocardiopsis coralliicola]